MRVLLGCLAALFLVGIVGCPGSGPPGPPPAAKVVGTIKLDGKPMPGGELRFEVAGFPSKALVVKDGSFQGEVLSGKNTISASLEKDGPPHPMDPKTRLKVNVVSEKFAGPQSALKAELGAGDNPPLQFEVTSKR